MKKISYRNRLLALVLILVCGFIVIPQPSQASTLDTLGKILDLIHPFDPQQIPSSSDLSKLEGLIKHVVDDPEHVADYIVQYSSVLKGNDYGDTIVMVAQLYVDIENTDVWGIVGIVAKWLGDDAPCIIAGIVLPGVGGELCDLVKEVVEFLEDIGGAIVEFFKSIGDAIICAFKKCCLGGQALYNRQSGYVSHEGEGVAWREDPTKDTFWDNEVPLSNYVCNANPDACLVDLQNAQNAFIAIVGKKWDADMMTRVLPNIITPVRNAYDNQAQIANLAAQAAPMALQGGDAGQWITKTCSDNFSQYAYFDRWVNETSNKAKAGTNASWCSGTFWWKNRSKFAKEFGKYVNQNLCPNFLCGTVANFQACTKLADSVSGAADWHCGIDPVAMGKDMAPMINALLHQATPTGDGSQVSCTVDKNTIVCQRGTQKLFCEKRYESFAHSNLNFVQSDFQKPPLVKCTFIEQGAYKDMHDKLKALYATPGSPFFGLSGDQVDPMRVGYMGAFTPWSQGKTDPQLLGKIQNDPAYKLLGFVTKGCMPGEYVVDGEPHPTICITSSKPPVTTPGGSPEERLKQGIDQLRHPGPDPRTTVPSGLDESLLNKFDGKTLKSGATLKVINGLLFIRTRAGAQVAVRNQILELQDGGKIIVREGKIIQEVTPGMKLNR